MADATAPNPHELWLRGLELENIGPFVRASLSFCHDDGSPAPVTLLTGQSGTGKTLVLDALRQVLLTEYRHYSQVALLGSFGGRELLRSGSASGRAAVAMRAVELCLRYERKGVDRPHGMPQLLFDARAKAWAESLLTRFVFDYWDTSLPQGSFVIENFARRKHAEFQENSLAGGLEARSITDLICHFDYLRSSDDEGERRTGEALMEATREIASLALLDGGRFVRVERSSFTPLFEQAGCVVPMEQLSTGNTYLVARLLTLLGRMHSAQVVRGAPPERLREAPGLLLLDEVEAHLHPRWQSRVLPGLRRLFPNMQIVATTHSPFVLASAPDAKVLTTRLRADGDGCEVIDGTRDYSALPIEQILASEAFDFTVPFGPEVATLFSARTAALEAGRFDEARALEDQLLARNPDYFAWLRLRPARELEGAAE